MRERIRTIEELSLNAWPALYSLMDDGWILRLANGYTRRSNSVNPLYPGYRDVRAKVADCEAFYGRHGLKTVFKLTEAVYPEALDKILETMGYAREADTEVQILDLDRDAVQPDRLADLSDSVTIDWLAHFTRLSRTDPRHHATLKQILEAIRVDKTLAVLRDGDGVVSCAMAVRQADYMGIFDLVTDPAHRRQGHARQMVLNLLDWGRHQGAHTAYLQVMLNNPPALQLYRGLGFEPLYQYWYRCRA